MGISPDIRAVLQILKQTYPGTKYYLNFSNPLELLVAAILSAQVRDEVVNATTPALFKKFRSASDYARATPEELGSYINAITFWNNKAKHIIAACRILAERHGGNVPDTIEALTELPGIGRKTANAILINGFNKVVGIVVDTHVIRVAYRLGWTGHKNPEKIEEDLMRAFPRTEWRALPWLLKDHGRAYCKAPTPSCSRCPVERLCPKKGVTTHT